MKRIVASILSFLLVLPAVPSAWAQQPESKRPQVQSIAQSQPPAREGSREEELHRWWRSLSPEQRQHLRERHRQWQAMSSEQKQALRERLKAFRQLPPAQQEQVRKNYRRWRKLPPERR
ncbi:MAG: DUF3106 domain-containing protein, partial [candidate division NC10 bacterium]